MRNYPPFNLMATLRTRAAIPQSFLNRTGFLLTEAAELNWSIADEALEDFGATWHEAIVMCFLMDQEEGVSQQVIADSCHINKAIVVQILDGLEQRKLIRRSGHAEDRRVNVITLTGLGRRTGDRMISQINHKQKEKLFERLSRAEIDTLNELLRKIVLPEAAGTK